MKALFDIILAGCGIFAGGAGFVAKGGAGGAKSGRCNIPQQGV